MSIADRIREHAYDKYVSPARANNLSVVAIRAGDVHKALGLDRNWRNVCQSLRGNKLQTQYGLAKPYEIATAKKGNSSTTIFVFEL